MSLTSVVFLNSLLQFLKSHLLLTTQLNCYHLCVVSHSHPTNHPAHQQHAYSHTHTHTQVRSPFVFNVLCTQHSTFFALVDVDKSGTQDQVHENRERLLSSTYSHLLFGDTVHSRGSVLGCYLECSIHEYF